MSVECAVSAFHSEVKLGPDYVCTCIATHQIAEWGTCANQLTPRVLHLGALVVLCVCVCVRGPHLQLAQLSDKVGILAVSVSCSLVFKKGFFRTIAFWRS